MQLTVTSLRRGRPESTLRYFGPIFTPSLCHTSRDLLKYVTHLGPPIFSSTCIHTCPYRGFVLVRDGFCPGVCLRVFCLEGFVRGGFCPPPLPSEYIHYNRKLNITFNFRFHIYEIFFKKCDVTCSWTSPFPLSQTVTPSRTPSLSSVTYFIDGPLAGCIHVTECHKNAREHTHAGKHL